MGLKPGDRVCFGVVEGMVVGYLNTGNIIFLSSEKRENFSNIRDILKNNKLSDKLIKIFVDKYFGNRVGLSSFIPDEKRFLSIAPDQLKRLNNSDGWRPTLLRKRHLLIVMAQHYVRSSNSAKVQSLCEKIENIQAEIEFFEKRCSYA